MAADRSPVEVSAREPCRPDGPPCRLCRRDYVAVCAIIAERVDEHGCICQRCLVGSTCDTARRLDGIAADLRARPFRCIGTRGQIGDPGLRDPDAPCADYSPGERRPAASCETDGHYLCADCMHREEPGA